MALFLARAGLKMEPVLYKGGGPAMADVVAGHVPCYFGNLNELIPHAGGGRIRVFAVSGEQRAAAATGSHGRRAGLPGLSHAHLERLRRPRRGAARVIERIAREIGAACKDAAFAERLNKIGVDPACAARRRTSRRQSGTTSPRGRKRCRRRE